MLEKLDYKLCNGITLIQILKKQLLRVNFYPCQLTNNIIKVDLDNSNYTLTSRSYPLLFFIFNQKLLSGFCQFGEKILYTWQSSYLMKEEIMQCYTNSIYVNTIRLSASKDIIRIIYRLNIQQD